MPCTHACTYTYSHTYTLTHKQGDDVLLDETKVTPNNALPYFMFNLYEPGEEELQEFKKEQRRKQRMRIDDVDWSKVQRSV